MSGIGQVSHTYGDHPGIGQGCHSYGGNPSNLSKVGWGRHPSNGQLRHSNSNLASKNGRGRHHNGNPASKVRTSISITQERSGRPSDQTQSTIHTVRDGGPDRIHPPPARIHRHRRHPHLIRPYDYRLKRWWRRGHIPGGSELRLTTPRVLGSNYITDPGG